MSDSAYRSLTILAQQRASDPCVSAWVSAHAGSGKTYVLTQRVLRLLLEGVRPSQILCLTFTKAAAANMSKRIFDRLGKWALLDDATLSEEIEAMGAGAASRATLEHAPRLFARAVETPGGLKIQTIHAFCEKLLHMFPFEANAPAGFRVLDDMARADLLLEAKRRAIESAMRSEDARHAALWRVAGETTESGFDDLCDELLTHRDALKEAFDFETYVTRLRKRLGLRAHETTQSVEAEIMAERAAWPDMHAALSGGSANDQKLAKHLERAIALAPHSDGVESYLSVFYDDKGNARGAGKRKIITNGLADKSPGLLERMEAERDRLEPLIDKRRAAETAERSLALAVLGDAIVSEYEQAKRYRNLLDYDDLIERACCLLSRSSAAWVLYKLDAQIDHILLDEAQDTSAPQWAILSALVAEFCAGDSARATHRSFFAVGDDKQSIFSFQGAAPEKFDAMRRDFERDFTAAGRRFENVRLVESFRSAPGVLAAVDAVFNFGENGVGLSCDVDPDRPPLRHETAKLHVDSLVEIWSPIGPAGSQEPEDWRLPLDFAKSSDPAERLAQKIAAKIASLLAPGSGECVEDKEVLRPVEARDILIVVRKRGAFFEALIRALKAAHVPVAGADRLSLATHIAVNDLVALGRAVLLPDDDLTVATVLKSPLLGFDDDDLIALAPDRRASLCEALLDSGVERHRVAAETLAQWRRAAATLAPYEFFSAALGPGGGRRRLVARLGPEANDAIDEFLRLALSFERDESPSLTAFLAMVETLDHSIKRDMESAGGAVRVMTAHAAKGLEAKIVFLPDTCGAPAGKHDPKLFTLRGDDGLSLVWSPKMAADPRALAEAREKHRDAERAEHRRLLYVALTRAEERLYVAGYHGANGPGAGCWHEMIVSALEESCGRIEDADEPEDFILRYGNAPLRHGLASPSSPARPTTIPAFALSAAPIETEPTPPLRPSSAIAGADARPRPDESAASQRDAQRILSGRLTHALLQHLPDCPRERSREAGARFLALRGASLDAAERARILDAALSVIEDARLAQLFGAGSIAEVDIVAVLDEGMTVSGRVDRLAETETETLVADFKTGRPRDALDATQLRQLALYRAALKPIYPQRKLRCFVVFTQDASIIEATAEALEEAYAQAVANARRV